MVCIDIRDKVGVGGELRERRNIDQTGNPPHMLQQGSNPKPRYVCPD